MTHRPLPSSAVDPACLTWVGIWELVPHSAGTTPSAAEQQRCIQYLESCYLLGAFMEPEAYYWCHLGCDPREAPEQRDQPLTDGTWWFAGSTLHYLRVHNYVLPERVLQHLRRSQFVVPDVRDGKPRAQGSAETRPDAES